MPSPVQSSGPLHVTGGPVVSDGSHVPLPVVISPVVDVPIDVFVVFDVVLVFVVFVVLLVLVVVPGVVVAPGYEQAVVATRSEG